MSRRCQVLDAGGYWRDAPIASVRNGQVFRLFEEDNRPVRDEDGHERWRAVADARQHYSQDLGEYQWRVEAEAVPETEVERQATRGVGYFPSRQQGWRNLSPRRR